VYRIAHWVVTSGATEPANHWDSGCVVFRMTDMTQQEIYQQAATRQGARHARELAMLTNDPRLRAELLRVAAEMDAVANGRPIVSDEISPAPVRT
jgi:hypothetical protein